MPKCPPNKRALKDFDQHDHTRFLCAIKPFETTPKHATRGQTVRPHPQYDWLHTQKFTDWFITASHLFPEISVRLAPESLWPHRTEPTHLISFGNLDDAMLFAVAQNSTMLLPNEWWTLFENQLFKAHPLWPAIETSAQSLVRINGVLCDLPKQASILIKGEMPNSRSIDIRRSVGELWEDTWCKPPSEALFKTTDHRPRVDDFRYRQAG